MRGDGFVWHKTKAIYNLGEYIERKPIYPKNLTNHEQAYLLGVYLGDGNSYNGFDMQVKDFELAEHTACLLSKITKSKIVPKPYLRIRTNHKTNEIGFRVRVCSYNLKDWLESKTDTNFKNRNCVNYRKYPQGVYDEAREMYRALAEKEDIKLKNIPKGFLKKISTELKVPYNTIENWVYKGWKR